MMPIEDEMPPVGKQVIVYVEDLDGWEPPEYDIGHCWDGDSSKTSKWTLRASGEINNALDSTRVTAWCYLPPLV